MNRVQTHYAKLHAALPANMEIQNAWLLFNTKNDRQLYPELMRLGGRSDLTSAAGDDQDIWANWSVRRAGAAMDNGNVQRAVDILDAASQAFPDNLTVRKAVAGGYVQVGRSKEALALFKTTPMQDASAGDFQGAVGAALAANDKARLSSGCGRRCKDFRATRRFFRWRRGTSRRGATTSGRRIIVAHRWRRCPAAGQTLAHDLAYPDVSNTGHKARTKADLQQLLNPENEPFPKTTKLPPLPAYGPDPYNGRPPVALTQQQPTAQGQMPMVSAPTTTQIPIAATPAMRSPATRSTSTPLPVPAVGAPSSSTGAETASARPPRNVSKSASRAGATPPRSSSGPSGYSGQVNLPPSEENIHSTTPSPVNSTPPRQTPVYIPPPPEILPQSPSQPASTPPQPQSSVTSPETGSHPALRITTQPMDKKAAEAQALFAEQTDGQLTQGSAAQVHTLGNAPVALPSTAVRPALGANGQLPPEPTVAYNETQYTPSAQDAATGAYSAQKRQQSITPSRPSAQPPVAAPAQPGATAEPPATAAPVQPEPSKKTKHKAARTETVPTLVTAPGEQNPSQVNVPPSRAPETPSTQVPETPAPVNPGTVTTNGVSDEELQQQKPASAARSLGARATESRP